MSETQSAAILGVVFRRTRPLLALLITALSLSMLVGCGGLGYTKNENRPKVVVLNIRSGKAVRGDIVEVLKAKDYPLIPKKRYIQTARRLKAKKLRARHISKVSSELGVSAVISGRVKRRGKRRYLYVTVHDGPSGVRVERFRVRLTRKRALTEKSAKQLEERLLAALAEVKPVSPEADQADSESVVAEKPKKAKKARNKRETRAERRRRKRAEARERKREARERKKAERERKKREARERKEKALADKRRKEREEKARKERERKRKLAEERRKKRERAMIKKVAKPKTDNSGQVIDDESPF